MGVESEAVYGAWILSSNVQNSLEIDRNLLAFFIQSVEKSCYDA